MKNDIDLVITVRDRDTTRLEKQIQSIRQHGADPNISLVDYGSSVEYANKFARIAQNLKLDYIQVYSQGWPWNKCHAINIAVKNSSAPFIVTSDLDMLYDSNPFEYCLNKWRIKQFYSINGFWMRKENRKENARCAGKGNYGFFLFTDRIAYELSGGYDERIVYWGLEDLDWPERLKALGYDQEWLPAEHKIYHQWHPSVSSGPARPMTASINTMRYCLDNTLAPVCENTWGKMVTKNDRPILRLLESGKKPFELSINPNELMHFPTQIRLAETKKEGWVKVSIGNRLIQRPLDKLRNVAKSILRPLSALTGNTVVDKTNCNFDYLYEMLPVLRQHGVIDYYIEPSLDVVYLLWE